MMKTLELLRKIEQNVVSRPDLLSAVEWKDVVFCVKQELEIRSVLYDSQQFSDITDHLDRMLHDLTAAARFGDLSSVRKALYELIGIVLALPSIEYFDKSRCRTNRDHAALRHYQENTAIVMGDSHVNFFSGNELLTFTAVGHEINLCPSENRFTALHLGPCLAYTCNHEDSSTGFSKKTRFLLEHFIRPGARIIVSLGEIDLRVHVLRQAAKQGRDYTGIIDDILKNYMDFLGTLKEKGYTVFCWGPIASQKDDTPQDPAFPRYGNEIDRNRATGYFTEKLCELCAGYDITALSIFPQMITEDYRTRGEYLSSDHFHLSQRAMELARPLLLSVGLLP